jgi:Peroxiredoxin
MKVSSFAVLVCLLPIRGPAIAQQPAADPYAEEFKTISRDFSKAQDAYYEPFRKAKTDDERQKIKLDPATSPFPIYCAKFQALAKKADGTPTGAKATMWVANLAGQSNKPEVAKQAYRTLLTKYAGMPEAEQAAAGLRYAGYTMGPEEPKKLLRGVIDGKANEKVKAAALFTLGAIMLDDRSGSASGKQEARQLFDRLKRDYPQSAYAKRADGAIFELEKLAIGQAAPDFEATDEANKKFKLSDYKGKVVVLDFWGFW